MEENLREKRPLFFYRFLNPVNDISGQHRHFMFRFCMVNKLSHNFTVIGSLHFEGTFHAKIFAHKRGHFFTISFFFKFS